MRHNYYVPLLLCIVISSCTTDHSHSQSKDNSAVQNERIEVLERQVSEQKIAIQELRKLVDHIQLRASPMQTSEEVAEAFLGNIGTLDDVIVDSYDQNGSDRDDYFASAEDVEKLANLSTKFNKILDGSIEGGSYGPDSEEVLYIASLAKVDLKLVLDEFKQHPENSYISMALEEYSESSQKAQILEAFKSDPNLSNTVYIRNWHYDAVDSIRLHWEDLRIDDYPPIGLSESIADLRIPETYARLKEWYITGWNQAQLDPILRKNPNIDYSEWSSQMWEHVRFAGDSDVSYQVNVAIIAAGQGNYEALQHAATLLSSSDSEALDSGTESFLTDMLLVFMDDSTKVSLPLVANGEQVLHWNQKTQKFHL